MFIDNWTLAPEGVSTIGDNLIEIVSRNCDYFLENIVFIL